MICCKCGKETAGEGIAFCPYCGERLPATEEKRVSKEVQEWIQKAMKATSLPERKKILEQAKKEYPDEPEIDWELLFIGSPDPKPPKGKMDFSIIKSWLLQIYRKPEDFSGEKRDAMRFELFHSPQLEAALAAAENPEGRMRDYLDRICREYINIFLKEDNLLMGNLFGLRIGRNRDRVLENAVAEMVQQVETDEQLTDEQKKMLSESLVQALRS